MQNYESKLKSLEKRIVACRLCPRLNAWCEEIARKKVARFSDQKYWGKPIPGFGDPKAKLLIVGLAPAAHGANRTGRLFTGDRSGDWLYRALHQAGFANQPESTDRNDGLKLNDCFITAAARCAPPANKLTPDELSACRPFLEEEWEIHTGVKVIVALGLVAYQTVLRIAAERGLTVPKPRPTFGHGVEVRIDAGLTVIASYHPSQQNTFTGRLTRPMFQLIFHRARKLAER